MDATQLNKIQPSSDKDKAALEKAKNELEKGASVLVELQKHICIADQSEHSQETVAAYIGNDIATNEKDARPIEKAEKTAKQLVFKRKLLLLPLPVPPIAPRERRLSQEYHHRDRLNLPYSYYQDHHMDSHHLHDQRTHVGTAMKWVT